MQLEFASLVCFKCSYDCVCLLVITYKSQLFTLLNEPYRPASETPFKWRFAVGSKVAGDGMMAGNTVYRYLLA